MTSNTSGNEVNYRLSSTLIVVVKSEEISNGYDYKILMIKRSERTAAITEQAVFPGGLLEKSDESEEWLKYFEEFGVRSENLQYLVLNENIPRPSIFHKPSYTKVAREISLRINALRETFEEVGVLLCRTREQLNEVSGPICAFYKNDFDKDYWQDVVHNNPKEFLRMCQELKVIPDLWGLYEWCGWASPPSVKKRNETVFFVTFLPERPSIKIELSEAKEFLWETPLAYLQYKKQRSIGFWPPQIYELSRCVSVKSFESLLKFSEGRSKKGITMYMHVIYICTDGLVSLLPGDELYPENPRRVMKYTQLDMTMAQFRAQSKRISRMENINTPDPIIRLNIEPVDGHLVPWTEESMEISKL